MKTILFIYQNFNWTQSFILRIIHDFFSNSEMKKTASKTCKLSEQAFAL